MDIQHNDQDNDTHPNDIKYNDTQHDDTQHNDTQHNDTQRNDTQHNDTQHNDTQHNDTQHNDTQHNDTSITTLIRTPSTIFRCYSKYRYSERHCTECNCAQYTDKHSSFLGRINDKKVPGRCLVYLPKD
jgi:hypothetical protein